MRAQVEAHIKEVITLVYFMRGSVSYTEGMELTYVEKQLMSKFIEDRLESESKNPFSSNY